jgi:hypothetical protein
MIEYRTDSFAAIRSSFPGTKRGPYLDVAARGLFYEGGRSALEDHLRDAQDGTIDKKALFAKVKNVPQSGGTIWLRSILDNTDSSCRAEAVSAVSLAPGFCFPIAELGAECRKRGVLLIVDAPQSIGVVARWYVDVLAASTQKGLMSLYGMGLLYVRGDLAQPIRPASGAICFVFPSISTTTGTISTRSSAFASCGGTSAVVNGVHMPSRAS